MRLRNKTVLTYRCYPHPTGGWSISHASRSVVALTQIQNGIYMAVKLPSDVRDANVSCQSQQNYILFLFQVVASCK